MNLIIEENEKILKQIFFEYHMIVTYQKSSIGS